jgi:hypothetical protein
MTILRGVSGALLPDDRSALVVAPLQFNSVQAAINAVTERTDIIVDNFVEHDETLTLTKNKVSILGVGALNSTRITSVGTHSTGLTINGGDDILLENLNISGRGTGAGLKLTGHVRRIHARNCRFAGGADGVLIEASSGGQVADVTFENCRFEGTNGVHFTAGGGDPASQIYFKNCDFQYCGDYAIKHESGVWSTGLFVQGCNFLPEEDGTAPAQKWIEAANAAQTGMISGCFFADTVHEADRIAIDAGVLYVGNYAEEGINTTRPD